MTNFRKLGRNYVTRTAVFRVPGAGGGSAAPAKHCAFDIQLFAFSPVNFN
jgi:hypothetical protein